MRRPGLAWLVLGVPLVAPELACQGGPSSGDELADTSTSTSTSSTSSTSGESESESSGEPTETDGCVTGSLGCVCDEDGHCAAGLACVAGVCEFVGCEAGSYACSCLPDGTCSEEWLLCEAGLCEYACTLGSAGCECAPSGCEVGLECIEGECWAHSVYPNCGWNDDLHWYACGSHVMYPWGGLACPEIELVAGAPCPVDQVATQGCCDANGNNWWCEGGVLAFDDCSDAP